MIKQLIIILLMANFAIPAPLKLRMISSQEYEIDLPYSYLDKINTLDQDTIIDDPELLYTLYQACYYAKIDKDEYELESIRINTSNTSDDHEVEYLDFLEYNSYNFVVIEKDVLSFAKSRIELVIKGKSRLAICPDSIFYRENGQVNHVTKLGISNPESEYIVDLSMVFDSNTILEDPYLLNSELFRYAIITSNHKVKELPEFFYKINKGRGNFSQTFETNLLFKIDMIHRMIEKIMRLVEFGGAAQVRTFIEQEIQKLQSIQYLFSRGSISINYVILTK